jgi:adenine-specific DNA methylase
LEALMKAAFVITASHPIKGEMSVAAPKHQAKEPIDLDIILVCRKREGTAVPADDGLREAVSRATGQIARFRRVGRKLSRNDVRVILMGQVLRVLSAWPSIQTAEETLTTMDENIEARIDELQGVK